jgi:hypothetical protein
VYQHSTKSLVKKIKIYFSECPRVALGKECFAECQPWGTRQSFFKNPKSSLCRVLISGHSAKTSLPSAGSRALGKAYFLIFKKSLSSARSRALGKDDNLSNRCALGPFHFLRPLYPSPPRTAASPAPPPPPPPPLPPQTPAAPPRTHPASHARTVAPASAPPLRPALARTAARHACPATPPTRGRPHAVVDRSPTLATTPPPTKVKTLSVDLLIISVLVTM